MIDYESHVGGPIGPVARSFPPGFTTTTLSPSTELAGTVASPEELLNECSAVMVSVLRASMNASLSCDAAMSGGRRDHSSRMGYGT